MASPELFTLKALPDKRLHPSLLQLVDDSGADVDGVITAGARVRVKTHQEGGSFSLPVQVHYATGGQVTEVLAAA